MLDLEPATQPLVQVSGRWSRRASKTLARLSVAAARLRAPEVPGPVPRASRTGAPPGPADRSRARLRGRRRSARRDAAHAGLLHLCGLPARLPGPDSGHRGPDRRGALGAGRPRRAVLRRRPVQDAAERSPGALRQGVRPPGTGRLGQIRIRRLTADKPRYLALTAAAAAATSPLKALFKSIRRRDRLDPRASGGPSRPTPARRRPPRQLFSRTRSRRPVRPSRPVQAVRRLGQGGKHAPADRRTRGQLNDIRDNLITAANVPSSRPRPMRPASPG